jgi:hypothetical protein
MFDFQWLWFLLQTAALVGLAAVFILAASLWREIASPASISRRQRSFDQIYSTGSIIARLTGDDEASAENADGDADEADGNSSGLRLTRGSCSRIDERLCASPPSSLSGYAGCHRL